MAREAVATHVFYQDGQLSPKHHSRVFAKASNDRTAWLPIQKIQSAIVTIQTAALINDPRKPIPANGISTYKVTAPVPVATDYNVLLEFKYGGEDDIQAFTVEEFNDLTANLSSQHDTIAPGFVRLRSTCEVAPSQPEGLMLDLRIISRGI